MGISRRDLLSSSIKFAGVAGLASLAAPRQIFAQDGGVIRIGAPLPLTGPLAPEGQKQRQGYEVWAKIVNGQGGIDVGGKRMKVEILYADYESKTPRAVQIVEKMVREDGAKFVLGPMGSGATKASSAITERYKIPMMAPTAAAVEVFDQGYKYLFGTLIENSRVAAPIVSLVKAQIPGLKQVAVLSRNDLFPLSMATELDKAAKAADLQVPYFEKYAIGTMDHATAITQIMQRAPQWLFATGYINDLVLMRKQLADQGAKISAITMISAPAYKEFTTALAGLADGVSSATYWHEAANYSGEDVFGTAANFAKLFREAYGADPDYTNASSAACCVVLQYAIGKAKSVDGEAVRDEIAKMKVPTFFGEVSFGPTGMVSTLEPVIFQIQKGKPVVLSPDSIKQGALQSMV